ncbi:Lysosomal acid lipase/cholesteryl ester hydrolase [Schistosoma japonicum]|uniref:Lipase n=4 Tax=Schistosoma japonicum TaxID=6182 RepID=A0A4Z2D1U7_SCHJA|nr:Lysosomal acid lipase/cholesteryl ester hydrolase [Schistosoma japonicum]TNN10477.1 Lysosomal acid lipase/cholesteryl ester hydrolase [Schistosoma japonicum]
MPIFEYKVSQSTLILFYCYYANIFMSIVSTKMYSTKYIMVFVLLIRYNCSYSNPLDFLLDIKSDPEIYMNISEIIRKQGYAVEEHEITTNDDYILCLVRLYTNQSSYRSRKVVLLQHGLLDSSHAWVMNLRNQSLGYILADYGYDVWLGNSRGSTYSKKHKHFNSSQMEYWDFSWQEMSSYDFPATVKYITSITKTKQLSYVGFSQGSLIAMTALDAIPELQSYINLFIALGPVGYFASIKGVFLPLVHHYKIVQFIVEYLTNGEVLPSGQYLKFLGKYVCGLDPYLCMLIINSIAGNDGLNTNLTRLPLIIAHSPAGTSIKNLVHFSQMINSHLLQKFDYGQYLNRHIYGQNNPPIYTLERFNIPTVIYHGGNDYLCTNESIDLLKQRINKTIISVNYIDNYNHLGYFWSTNAVHRIYSSLLGLIAKYQR